MVAQHEWLKVIGENLRGGGEDIVREALPRRWVDLIRYLDEQERRSREYRTDADGEFWSPRSSGRMR